MDHTDLGASGVRNKFGTQTRCVCKPLVHDGLGARIVKLPLADAVKRALSASVVRNGKQSWKHSQNLGIEFGAFWFFGFAVDGKDVPPHITCAVEWVGWLLVEVRQVWRTANGHDLLEKWDE